ncbi:hypothetical protein niasHT_033865 [Heterodera trifolii]|uniref:Uncharacterized protein n=1 Tax=Heterodera trifolii TaxID=157864 RepID=A0ABD2I7N1_9BILA
MLYVPQFLSPGAPNSVPNPFQNGDLSGRAGGSMGIIWDGNAQQMSGGHWTNTNKCVPPLLVPLPVEWALGKAIMPQAIFFGVLATHVLYDMPRAERGGRLNSFAEQPVARTKFA